MKNVHFISLGCARNLVDSEVMAGLMDREGYALTGEASEADLIVVNTCGFIDSAKEESINTILEAAEHKQGRCQKLVVAGCLAERYPGEIKSSIPEVDLVIGTASFDKIVKEVNSLGLKDGEQGGGVRISKERIKDYDLPRINSQPFYTAFLKLAEGCAKRCSFCIIPKLRGNLRSRSVESLVKEANDLTQSGVRELNLIAQDLTDYGRDRGDGATLAGLLRELVQVKDAHWLRLFYTYPDQLDDEVLELIKSEKKICNYLDAPIQHVNDRVLRGMNRKSQSGQIRRMVERLKTEIPDIVLRTSLMVGFPGETKAEFKELLDFVNEGFLDQIGIFTYSAEEGTAAYRLKDNVSAEEKEERRAALYEAQMAVQKKALQKWVGREVEVLVEGPHEETDLLLRARHYGQAAGVDNCVLINAGYGKVGAFHRAKITEVAGLDLVGEIL